MRYFFLFLLLIVAYQGGKTQSLRPLDGLEYGPALYSARHQQIYVFEGRENRPSLIKIMDEKDGRIKKTIPVDSFPTLSVMSSDERFIYFVTLFPLKINRFDLNQEQVIASVPVPTYIQNINGLNLIPGHQDRLALTWYNAEQAGIALLEQGKWTEAKNTGTFGFHGIALPNDSTFYATTVINHTFIKGKIGFGTIAITDTITGLPYLSIGQGIMQDGYYYLPQGYLLDLRGDRPVLLEQKAPTSPFGYNQVRSFPASPYVYYIEDLFNGFKVYKIRKADQQSAENWTIPKESGSSSFTLLIALQNDGFFMSNYSRSYLYKRCSSTAPLPVIREGYSLQACLTRDSSVTLHANHTVHEYLWSTGASTSSLTLTGPASLYLQYGDSLGCLTAPSPVANINFYPPRNGPWLNGKSEAFSIQTCAKQDVFLTAMESGFQHFEWSNGASGSTIVVNQNGKYRVRSIDATGCPSLWSATATIEQLPDSIPDKPVIQTTTGRFNYCEGEVAQLYVPTGYHYYIWQGKKTSQAIWEVKSTAWISVQVGNDPRCLSALSDPAMLNFYARPKMPVIQRLGTTLATNNFGEKHEWYFNDQLLPEENGQFLNIAKNGSYRVRTKVNDCYSSFSPNFTVQDLLTSTRNVRQDSSLLTVHPNPVQDGLFIRAKDLNLQDCIYQVVGLDRVLLQSGLLSYPLQINTTSLPPGFYLLLLKDKQGATHLTRFIKH